MKHGVIVQIGDHKASIFYDEIKSAHFRPESDEWARHRVRENPDKTEETPKTDGYARAEKSRTDEPKLAGKKLELGQIWNWQPPHAPQGMEGRIMVHPDGGYGTILAYGMPSARPTGVT